MSTTKCTLCPRNCGLYRWADAGNGICGVGMEPRLARAGLHMWEEPCVSGEHGSGAVFFSGCPLKCVFCQNKKISTGGFGKQISVRRLREIYFELIEQGAHNINLVNPTHFADAVVESLTGGLPVPVVYNSGGYDSIKALQKVEGLIQVYLPDMKYMDKTAAARYSMAADYPDVARRAILEMFRQRGRYVLSDDGIIQSGVIIRHLILPGNIENTLAVIDWVEETFAPGDVLFSLMSQYTPCGELTSFPEINRRLTKAEYARVMNYLEDSAIEDGFFQELSSAGQEYIPDFDLTGI